MDEFEIERSEFAKQHKIAEKQMLPYFRKALRQHIAPFVRYIEVNSTAAVPRGLISTLLDNSVWAKVYNQVYEKIGVKFARREYYRQKKVDNEEEKASIGFLIDIWSSILRDYSLTYVYNISRELTDTTIKIIEEALSDIASLELDEKGRVRLLIKNITDKMKLRSLTISRTETTTVSNIGKEIGAVSWINEQGGQGYRVWLGRIARERDTHIAVNNTVLPLDEMYTVGTEQALRPGDVHLSAKERINCRCSQTIMSQNRYNSLVKRGRIVNGKLLGASGGAY